MSESVYEKDRRILADTVARLTGASDGPIYRYAREEIDVDLTRREAYSYGRHFPLFRFVPRELNGRPAGAPEALLALGLL